MTTTNLDRWIVPVSGCSIALGIAIAICASRLPPVRQPTPSQLRQQVRDNIDRAKALGLPWVDRSHLLPPE